MPFEKGHKPWNSMVGNTHARKHGLNSLKRLLDGPKVDGRTSIFRALAAKERELITALGGDPSPQERLLIADAVKTLLYIGTLDEYLMGLNGGIIKGGKVIAVIESRTQLAAHLRRDLEALGLKRVAKEATLDDLISTALEQQETSSAQNASSGPPLQVEKIPSLRTPVEDNPSKTAT